MAYRNTIISLATLVAFGTACSKAPSYNTGVQSAATENADDASIATQDPGHGQPAPTSTTTDTAANTPKPTETPAAPPANKPADPAAPKPLTEAERAKAMNTKGFVAYAVASADGAGWNTAATPFLLAPSVSAAGAVDGAKPFEAIFCNYRGVGNANAMQLHSSSGDGPAAHGNAIPGAVLPDDPAAPGVKLTMAQAEAKLNAYPTAAALLADTANANCRAHRINALGVTPGATYNHRGGNEGNAASHVHFKIMTVDPAGVVK